MTKFRKRPVEIEATQWFKNGDHPEDYMTDLHDPVAGENFTWTAKYRELQNWEGDVVRYFRHPPVDPESGEIVGNGGVLMGPMQHSQVPERFRRSDCHQLMDEHGWIYTPEGGHTVCPGDWVITGVQGEYERDWLRDENQRITEQREALVDASLAVDYTVDHDCGTAVDDPDAYKVALTNIREMHRLLEARLERLLEANEERDRLTEERDGQAGTIREQAADIKRMANKLSAVRQLAAEWKHSGWVANGMVRDLRDVLRDSEQAERCACGEPLQTCDCGGPRCYSCDPPGEGHVTEEDLAQMHSESDVTDDAETVQSAPENERHVEYAVDAPFRTLTPQSRAVAEFTRSKIGGRIVYRVDGGDWWPLRGQRMGGGE